MLDKIHQIDWANVGPATGPGTAVPRLLEDLLSDDPEPRDDTVEAISVIVTYNLGCVTEAALLMVPFLIEALQWHDFPKHANVLSVLSIFLSTASNNRYSKDSPRLYQAIHKHFDLYKTLIDHPDPQVRRKAVIVLCHFDDDADDLVVWLQGKIETEQHVKTKTTKLRQIVSSFSETDIFKAHRGWYLEQVESLLAEQNSWVRLIAASMIIRITKEQTDEGVVNLLSDLIIERCTTFTRETDVWDEEGNDFYVTSWVFSHLGAERCIHALLRTIEPITDHYTVQLLAFELADQAFPKTHSPGAPLSELQKDVLRLLVAKDELWADHSHLYVLSENGLPDTRDGLRNLIDNGSVL